MLGKKKILSTSKPSRDVWGQFNGQMVDAFIVHLDEVSSKELIGAEGYIKNLITEPYYNVNQKGKPQQEIISYHRVIKFANGEETFKDKQDDRRNMTCQCSNELCKNIPGKSTEELARIDESIEIIRKSTEDVNYVKTIYEWLKTRNVVGFPYRPIPKSDFQKENSILTMSPVEVFIRYYIEECHNMGIISENHTISSNELFSAFSKWKLTNYTQYECNVLQFHRRLALLEIDGIDTKKGKSMNSKTFNIPLLMKKFELE
jgi:hypothetical protein